MASNAPASASRIIRWNASRFANSAREARKNAGHRREPRVSVDYNAHVLESVLKYVAPEPGWR